VTVNINRCDVDLLGWSDSWYIQGLQTYFYIIAPSVKMNNHNVNFYGWALGLGLKC
jgi:hypothetical protein